MLANAPKAETRRRDSLPDARGDHLPGQYNLFTGELEPIPESPEPQPRPETPWLFDPDFRLVLPEDRAGKEVLLEPRIVLQFEVPNAGFRASGANRVSVDRCQATGHREQGIEGGLS